MTSSLQRDEIQGPVLAEAAGRVEMGREGDQESRGAGDLRGGALGRRRQTAACNADGPDMGYDKGVQGSGKGRGSAPPAWGSNPTLEAPWIGSRAGTALARAILDVYPLLAHGPAASLLSASVSPSGAARGLFYLPRRRPRFLSGARTIVSSWQGWAARKGFVALSQRCMSRDLPKAIRALCGMANTHISQAGAAGL